MSIVGDPLSNMKKDIVVVGASAGGVPALQGLVAGLPGTFEGSLFIVLHTGPADRSTLDRILQKSTKLPVVQLRERELRFARGHIYVAMPDHHLILESDTVCLTRGPRENRVRPSIDVLFRSAAYAHGARVVGVVLSGTLDDGAAGLWWIKRRGGAAIVQAPNEAQHPDMPLNALKHAEPDYVLPVSEMGAVLAALGERDADSRSTEAVAEQLEMEVQIAKEKPGLDAGIMQLGKTTPYTCPECHGVLLRLENGGGTSFRCHTGHAYTSSTLLADVTENVEKALWNALRIIEESSLLLGEMARRAGQRGDDESVVQLLEGKVRETTNRANVLRSLTYGHRTLSEDNVFDVHVDGRADTST
jgi:two-component system chemotaxis response regulator CheB